MDAMGHSFLVQAECIVCADGLGRVCMSAIPSLGETPISTGDFNAQAPLLRDCGTGDTLEEKSTRPSKSVPQSTSRAGCILFGRMNVWYVLEGWVGSVRHGCNTS